MCWPAMPRLCQALSQPNPTPLFNLGLTFHSQNGTPPPFPPLINAHGLNQQKQITQKKVPLRQKGLYPFGCRGHHCPGCAALVCFERAGGGRCLLCSNSLLWALHVVWRPTTGHQLYHMAPRLHGRNTLQPGVPVAETQCQTALLVPSDPKPSLHCTYIQVPTGTVETMERALGAASAPAQTAARSTWQTTTTTAIPSHVKGGQPGFVERTYPRAQLTCG